MTEGVGVAIMLMTRIREVLSSILDRDTDSPDEGVLWFSTVSTDKCRDNTSIKPRPLLSKSLPVRDSSDTLPFGPVYMQSRY
jgi:hypothetical protein